MINKTQYYKGFWYYTDGSFLGESSHVETLVTVDAIKINGLPTEPWMPFMLLTINEKVDYLMDTSTVIIIKYHESVTHYEDYDNIIYDFIVEKKDDLKLND